MKVLRKLQIPGAYDYVPGILYEEDGVLYVKRDDSDIIHPYTELSKQYGCRECVHLRRPVELPYLDRLGTIDMAQCTKIDSMSSHFKVLFRATPEGNHPVCKFFEDRLKWPEDNVNSFFSYEVSCYRSGIVQIEAIICDGKEMPFSFSVDGQEWENLTFIKNRKIRLLYPTYCGYILDGKRRMGSDGYIKLYGLDKYRKEIKETFSSYGNARKMCHNRVFNFRTMWFD